MLDLIFGLYLLAMLVRGWFRGLIKELFDLAGLAIGLLLAFRASGPVGDLISSTFGFDPEWSRVVSGVVIFVVVAIALALISGRLSKWVKLPGLNLPNRAFGAGLGFVWGLFLLVLLVIVLQTLPIPEGFEERLDDSRVVANLAEEDARLRGWLEGLVGDTALHDLEAIFIPGRVVLEGDDREEIDRAALEDQTIDPVAAREIFDLLNQTRIEHDADPVAWSDGLERVARDHAQEMYTDGYIGYQSDKTGNVEDRLRKAEINLVSWGEHIALAGSVNAVHDSLTSDKLLLDRIKSSYDRVGIAAIRGPSGLMVVEVLGGA